MMRTFYTLLDFLATVMVGVFVIWVLTAAVTGYAASGM